jgi:AcrR family transcriptional regulator
MKTSRAKRSYRQTARAAAAEATGERILDVFTKALRDSWFDSITLDNIARDAAVTVQTVIRRFGSKEGLLEAARERFGQDIRQRRSVPVGDVEKAIAAIIADYETVGDLIMRVLAQEDRHAPLRAVADEGRSTHRWWVETNFAPWLDRLEPRARTAALDALVVATDLYVWKLIRRDMGRPRPALAALMRRMIGAALEPPETETLAKRTTEKLHGSRQPAS